MSDVPSLEARSQLVWVLAFWVLAWLFLVVGQIGCWFLLGCDLLLVLAWLLVVDCWLLVLAWSLVVVGQIGCWSSWSLLVVVVPTSSRPFARQVFPAGLSKGALPEELHRAQLLVVHRIPLLGSTAAHATAPPGGNGIDVFFCGVDVWRAPSGLERENKKVGGCQFLAQVTQRESAERARKGP